MTYNQWLNLFEQFATANQFIKGFYHGHNSLRHFEKDIQYPFMHLMYMNSSYTLQAETVVFEVLFMDLPVKKHFELEMETEILSDMKQAAEDLIAEIRNGMTIFQFTDKITIVDSRINPLVDKDQHVITGVSLDLTLEVPYTADACLAPFEGSLITGGCPTLADLWQTIDVINSIGCSLHPDITSPTTIITIPNINVEDINGADFGAFPTPSSIRVESDLVNVEMDGCDLVIYPDVPPPATDIVYQRSTFRGQLTSYDLYDAGWQAAQGVYDYSVQVGTSQRLDYTHAEPFYNLVNNNAFGNKYRFTDSNGLQAPDNLAGFASVNWSVDRPTAIAHYVIDHLTGLGWVLAKVGFNEDWVDALATAHNFTHGGYSDYRLPSPSEIIDVVNLETVTTWYGAGNIFYRSSAFAAGLETRTWLNESNPVNSSQGRNLNDSGEIRLQSKISNSNHSTIAVRTHYL